MSYDETTKLDENLFTFLREANNFDGYLIATNFGKSAKKYDFKQLFASTKLPDTAKVVYFDWFDSNKNNDFELENKIQTNRILLNPGEFLVLSYIR